MKITFLGTAAAAGFPGVFCHCEQCNEARRLKGKNIRTRSQAMINDDLLIDFPPDSYLHFLRDEIDSGKISHMLVTHSHGDHFYTDDFIMRGPMFAQGMQSPTLQIFCSKGAQEKFRANSAEIPDTVTAQAVTAYQTFAVGEYTVTALPANHMIHDGAVIYVIERDGKTILYAHDTGYFFEEVFTYIEKAGWVFDLITMDCTQGDIPIANTGGHMGFANITQLLDRLTAMGAVTENTVKVVSHFAHESGPLHERLERRAAECGCLAAYDGLRIEI